MHLLLSSFLFLLSIVFVSADVVMYTRSEPPSGWEIQTPAPSHAKVNFILALKQQNLHILNDHFWEVSNPESPRWRQHLSIEEINAIIAPDEEDVSTVRQWLTQNGVHEHAIESLGDALEVHTTVTVAESLFSTDMYFFYHEERDQLLIRQNGTFSVPDHIHPLIDMVTGLSTFPVPHFKAHSAAQSTSSSSNSMAIVPESVYTQYGIPAQTAGSAASTTSQAAIAFSGNTFDAGDLSSFGTLASVSVPTIPTSQIIGPNSSPGTTEGTLDTQYLASVNIQASNWYWLESTNNWLYSFAIHFFNSTTVPQVISISYGWWEGDQCDSIINPNECSALGVDTWGYITRVDTEFQKIGLRGVSIIAASGDSGTHTETDQTCSASTLRVEYPASSPYVTAVGATQLTNGVALSTQPTICTQLGVTCASTGTEVAPVLASASFTSGGGFSAKAPVPSYQQRAVSAYLASGVTLPASSYYNASNRAIPDVSAVGVNTLIHYSGSSQEVGGTSASAPIFAAVIAMLNQASIARSGSPLGFLNPWLYSMAAAQPNTFHDVTTGDNHCSAYGCYSGCTGFYATSGWDPVTGLGTPNYPNMLSYIQSH